MGRTYATVTSARLVGWVDVYQLAALASPPKSPNAGRSDSFSVGAIPPWLPHPPWLRRVTGYGVGTGALPLQNPDWLENESALGS